ncbi:DUF1294 domain-containing protein [Arenimonas alkanexedens]
MPSQIRGRPKGHRPRAPERASRLPKGWLGLVSLLALVAGTGWAGLPVLAVAYAGMSALTFAVYAFDKSAAKSGRQRTPESTLHMLALFGGWPGAMAAQHWLRHKSVKTAFLGTFWATVLLNLGALAVWIEQSRG